MVMLNFLRALADLGFYYSFAGILSAHAGGRLVLAAMLFQSICFALSSTLRNSRIARMTAVLPGLILLFLPVPLADRIVSVPPALYLVYLAWMDNYQLSWRRQADQLSLFWKLFLTAVWVLSLLFWEAALSTGVPAALLAAAAQILLLRALRHSPEVYLQPKYQLINAASILLLALAAMVLGSEQAVRTAASALGSAYSALIAPLLQGAGAAIRYVFTVLRMLLELLSGDVKIGERPAVDPAEAALENELLQLEAGLPEGDISGMISAIVLAAEILAAAAVLFLFFRWMAQRQYDHGANGAAAPERSDLPERRRTAKHARSGAYAYQIRRQYRTFLRLCWDRGLEWEVSDTSTDIGEKSRSMFPNEAALADLRDIYQKARYQGEASREDFQRFKRLLGILKKTGR